MSKLQRPNYSGVGTIGGGVSRIQAPSNSSQNASNALSSQKAFKDRLKQGGGASFRDKAMNGGPQSTKAFGGSFAGGMSPEKRLGMVGSVVEQQTQGN